MTARAISIEAYEKHIRSNKRKAQWVRIYMHLKVYPEMMSTRSEMSQFTGMRMSSVCGRVHELLQANMIEELPRRTCSITKEPAHPLQIKQAKDPNQGQLI